jgi:hypothetical protein
MKQNRKIVGSTGTKYVLETNSQSLIDTITERMSVI